MTRSLIRLDSTVRTSLNDDCMTNSHDERQWDDNDDRTDDNTGVTKGYKREREGVGTIGLDWLGRGWREGWRGGRGMAAGLVPSAWPSPHSSPHSTSS